jgi:predicted SAM-dependent methyltransferase
MMAFPWFRRYRDRSEPLKLHVGCGRVRLEGWVNIDRSGKHLDVKCDVRKGLPYRDDSVALIYNEHFLEHLTCEEGLAVLREFHRVLKPGGVVRIATPDLDYLVAKYASEDWRKQNWILNGRGEIQTRAEMLNICFHDWGHQYLYNAEELERRLRQVGFAAIVRQAWNVSQHAELAGRETREDSKLVMEAVK